MTEEGFWDIIESSFDRGDPDLDAGLAELEGRLRALPRSEVLAFQRLLNAAMVRAYTWPLIGAACFVGSGQSDDGFEDFRAWLVSRGRATFERVLANPAALAALPFVESPVEEWWLEELHLLPGEVGGEEGDREWPYRSDPDQPAGEPLELRRAVLRERFPDLWQRFEDRFMIGIR